MASRSHKILSSSVTSDDKRLPTHKLPTKMQILRSRIAYTLDGLTYRDADKEVVKQIKYIYEKASIPTLTDEGLIKKIDAYYINEYRKIDKLPKSSKSANVIMKINKFLADADETMELWGNITNITEEDKAFLENMKSTRSAVMGPRDKITQSKAKKILEREKKQQCYQGKKRKELPHQFDSEKHSEYVDDSDETIQFDLPPPKRTHHRNKKTECAITIPHDILNNRKLNSFMVRFNISPVQIIGLLETLITECGGDPSLIHLTYNYAYRHREESLTEVSRAIKENFRVEFPLGLHWDGKIMDDLLKTSKSDRLPVIVSSSDGSEKLLGVPTIPIGTGPGTAGMNVASAVTDLLKDWGALDKIASMNFDTTPPNTGHNTGACISVQSSIGRPLLWNACRKHIGEIHIGHAWDILGVEVSSGPEISIFNRFKNNFHHIPLEMATLQLFDIDSIPSEHKEFFSSQTKVVVSTLNYVKDKGVYLRGDYQELLNLVLMYLGETPASKSIIHKPGATHKARWLMKLLHSLKIVILEDSLPTDILRRGQIEKVQRFVKFFVFCYVPWWFTCPIGTSAARNDLQFYNIVCEFEAIDGNISKAVKKSFQNHQWYIVPEMIPLALFDRDLENSEKNKLAKKILSFPLEKDFTSRHGKEYGKPKFQDVVPTNVVDAASSPDVWKFFEILQISHDFLKTPSDTWSDSISYLDGLRKTTEMKVCNDCAERGVKLIQDFLPQSKKETKIQEIVQAVEKSRADCPNIKKKSKKKAN